MVGAGAVGDGVQVRPDDHGGAIVASRQPDRGVRAGQSPVQAEFERKRMVAVAVGGAQPPPHLEPLPESASPRALRRAYAYWSEDGQDIAGASFWDTKEACDSWRASAAETQRREAMAPYIVEEQEGFYRGRGRELGVGPV